MTEGKWKPYSQVIGDQYMYIAGRQRDMSQTLHGGNIEYSGEYTANRDVVAVVCEQLNKEQ